MKLFVAWIVLGVGIGLLCADTVGMPILYGFFISSILCAIWALVDWLIGGFFR